ncbi:hypothetical protein IFM89_035238 [Coptis chinensis]|uniref:Protein transport protein SEC23 n=1 Tax=Coptis chinensis TaxID=261450 RepID=A0A835IHJ7_9MAGN|nr:hypothetical protein IFM89_035238 [Coptis chinensis]
MKTHKASAKRFRVTGNWKIVRRRARKQHLLAKKNAKRRNRLSKMIVSKSLSEPIRSHKDLDKDSVPFYHKAVKFYEGLSKQLVNQGHVLDVFACALDQVGLAELKVAVERTGGLVVLAESFGHSVFKDSLRRVFQSSDYDLGLSFK